MKVFGDQDNGFAAGEGRRPTKWLEELQRRPYRQKKLEMPPEGPKFAYPGRNFGVHRRVGTKMNAGVSLGIAIPPGDPPVVCIQLAVRPARKPAI